VSALTATAPIDTVPIDIPIAASAAVGETYFLAFSEVRQARRERALMIAATALAGLTTLVVAGGVLVMR
jgi:hypothetical protein